MDKIVTQHAIRSLKTALAPLAQYLDGPNVQEIMINGPDDVWVEVSGVLSKTDARISRVQIESAITVLARLNNKDAKEGTPDGIVDTRMEGFRIAATLPPTSVRGPSMCIRKHNPLDLSLQDYVTAGALTPVWAEQISQMVRAHKNILIAGGTSSGKTTFANAMIGEINKTERILTIEDTPELKVKVPNWVQLESNAQAGISTRDLVRLALRYRPDRIIIGEVRGGEAYDLLDAANTGHDGVLATCHANSSFDALSRFETLILRGGVDWPHAAICAQIARTFDFIIFMARVDGVRQLKQVLAVHDYDRVKQEYVTDKLFDLDDVPKNLNTHLPTIVQ